MQLITQEEIVKMQPKGILTIPKKIRESLGFQENGLVRLKADKGGIFIEPLRTLPYPVRSYTDKELGEFFELDREETKKLKNKSPLIKR